MVGSKSQSQGAHLVEPGSKKKKGAGVPWSTLTYFSQFGLVPQFPQLLGSTSHSGPLRVLQSRLLHCASAAGTPAGRFSAVVSPAPPPVTWNLSFLLGFSWPSPERKDFPRDVESCKLNAMSLYLLLPFRARSCGPTSASPSLLYALVGMSVPDSFQAGSQMPPHNWLWWSGAALSVGQGSGSQRGVSLRPGAAFGNCTSSPNKMV